MIRSVFFIFFIFTTIGCQKLSQDELLVNKIIDSHNQEQFEKNGIKLLGSGSSIPDKVRGFIMHYEAKRPMTIEDARYLFVTGIERLIEMINLDDNLLPYMANYPFTIDNLSYKVCFWDKTHKYYEFPLVSFMFLCKGNICYSFYDNEKQNFIDELDYLEPYSESYRMVYGRDRLE